ncbi:MAG: hypothetical protein WC323_04465, partial [Patescibacteria group bacterium]
MSANVEISPAECERRSVLPHNDGHCRGCESPFRLCRHCYPRHKRKVADPQTGMCDECSSGFSEQRKVSALPLFDESGGNGRKHPKRGKREEKDLSGSLRVVSRVVEIPVGI